MWIEQHKSKYRIRDLVNGKKVTVESGIPTKTLARERKKRLEIEQADYGPLKVGAGKENFGEWGAAWWKAHARTFGSANTSRTEGGRFKKHVIGRLGHLPIDQIDAAVVRDWIDKLADPDDAEYDPLGPKSIHNAHGYLYMALETAVSERIIRSNPCGHSRLPKWEPPEMRFLSERELAEVLALVPVQWRALAYFIAGTGCRVGEALGLKQRCVDVLGARVRFETQLIRSGGRCVDAPLKTRASKRTVGIPPSLCRVLAELSSVDQDAYVFLGPGQGRAVHYDVFRAMWQSAMKKENEAGETPYKGVRIHDLRHTHAAHLISKGRPLTSVQRRLGHSSIKVTSDIYGHLLPEVEDDTAAAVEEIMAAVDLGGIVGESIGAEPPSTDHDDSEGKKKPQVDAESAS